jgi:glycine cleavage system aminomethyltransferase T
LAKHILLAYLPSAYAIKGTRLQVEYLHECYPVTVAVVGATPLFDPDNTKVKS